MSRLPAAARIALWVGAAGSLALMLYAGRSNRHILITVLFIFWALAPFVAIAWAGRMAGGWAPATRATLYAATVIISSLSLAIYGYRAAFPPRATGAFVFVIVPPLSVLLVLIALSVASLISRRSSRKELM
ncbi:MAG: hypothetical protein ACREMI_04935 [Gemmatimonadales bacterium]